ncbi:Ku70-binding protein [Salpingoeca rosetta]|uniref:Mitochondrial inner membrane protease ATP23 n=1 Tax=Salpingoeca rosetta (strain ATCC 50818 / BSB-021) TaxID=946362 RepID=F2UAQ5_SALR5|nr:Ku70-binding protein [Salpingoeca rosetta]EGD73471.1 Ku70-binding protein [Salpingoeca rosetta]|eukprot:XP_004993753.1 Ku70-binding protein [Salpingoeca rosetta]
MAAVKAGAFTDCTEKQQERHDKWVNHLVDKDPFVKFMLDNLKKIGCPVDVKKFFVCQQCPVSGAFDADRNEIVLCADKLYSRDNAGTIMTHELIHAYDNCRAKLDFRNPIHLACTEVRAANLSGDCFFKNELNRGNFAVAKQHQVCVKRRASLSLQAVFDIPAAQANKHVDQVYDQCFKDTAPFEYIP